MYEFQELVLLIGTNPLPNYVVSRYLINNNPQLQRIWLIHSELNQNQKGTKKLADDFREVIKGVFSGSLQLASLENVASAKAIERDMREKVLGQLAPGVKVHLNYTGGTKAMAVHVYMTLQKNLGQDLSCSYLDARHFALRSDDDSWMSGDLRDEIFVDLETLTRLHGYQKDDKGDKTSQENARKIWSHIRGFFLEWIENGLLNEYLKWREEFLGSIYFDSDGFIDTPNKFKRKNHLTTESSVCDLKEAFQEKTPQQIKEMLRSIPEEFSLVNQQGELWIPDASVTNKQYKSRITPTVRELLHGKWLEMYVADCLEEKLARDLRIAGKTVPMETNWKLKKGDQQGKVFEIDVVLINGYQLCGISCTTDTKENRCKEKGFEVLHRVDQMGGFESKAVIVSGMKLESCNQLQWDLTMISGSTEEKLLVLGIDDLAPDCLWEKIKEHVFG